MHELNTQRGFGFISTSSNLLAINKGCSFKNYWQNVVGCKEFHNIKCMAGYKKYYFDWFSNEKRSYSNRNNIILKISTRSTDHQLNCLNILYSSYERENNVICIWWSYIIVYIHMRCQKENRKCSFFQKKFWLNHI